MRIAIVGSRCIKDKDRVYPIVQRFLKDHTHGTVTIVSGGASGVDALAIEYAKSVGLDSIIFEPYHVLDRKVEFSPKYFFIRNKQIVDNCDKVLAIWDGKSGGTEHTIKYAYSHQKPIMVVKLSCD